MLMSVHSCNTLADRLQFSVLLMWGAVGGAALSFHHCDAAWWRVSASVAIITAWISLDMSKGWVIDAKSNETAFLISRRAMQVATLSRFLAWVLFVVGVWATPAVQGYEWIWIVAGALWLVNASCVTFDTFDTNFKLLFGAADNADAARKLFRTVLHDALVGAFVIALGASVGDVFDGDADDSKWRSLLSAATMVQIFMTLWSHWGDLHTASDGACCGEDMRRVWIQLGRFMFYCVLFTVVLFRTHEDLVLVEMSLSLEMTIFAMVASGMLGVLSVLELCRDTCRSNKI